MSHPFPRSDPAQPIDGSSHVDDGAPTVSIVVPLFDEQDIVDQLDARLAAVIDSLSLPCEVVYVDDGSTDRTFERLESVRARRRGVALLRLSRNFGKEAALTAGLQASRGRCVVVLDADLQDPPELIPTMVDHWREGFDVVNMRRRRRSGETRFKRWSAGAFYRLLNRVAEHPIPCDVGDFRLLSRRAVDTLNAMPERNRYMKGLFAWVGFNQTTLDYDREARAGGVAKQRIGRLMGLAIDGITSFSIAPLRVAFGVGLVASLAAFATALFYGGKVVMFGDPVAGFPTLIVAELTLGGVNLMCLGAMGEYVGRLYIESKARPLFIVERFVPAADAAPTGGASRPCGKADSAGAST